MGKFATKTPYKKLLKNEKAKTKLKVSHKTVLPKGQNITNTNFKVKKIVLKTQLREHEGQIVSKNQHNVQELLSKLHHHNALLRCSCLTSLTDLMNSHADVLLASHLPSLLHSASGLIVDKEYTVRSEAIKLLTSILNKATDNQVAPLFETLIRYLACAMSHINANIRESSLTMLDVFIAKHPGLTARHCQPVVLPAFLDLISSKFSDCDRKLTMEYNDRMTSSAWRIKVLTRLRSLLRSMVDIELKQKNGSLNHESVKQLKWNNKELLYANLYHCPYDRNKSLDISGSTFTEQMDRTTSTWNYTVTLIPLLVDMFVEVAPNKTQNQRAAQYLSPEAAVLLKLISDIILLLWQIFDFSDAPARLKQDFCDKFGSLIMEHLLTGRFPYSLAEQMHSSKMNKVKMSDAEYLSILEDNRCYCLNIDLCHIYFLMRNHSSDLKKRKNIVQYFTNTLKLCSTLERNVIKKIVNCLDLVFLLDDVPSENTEINVIEFVKIMKELYAESATRMRDSHHQFVWKTAFHCLYKITMSKKFLHLNKKQELKTWLESLPNLLLKRKISFEIVTHIYNLARFGIPDFIENLDGFIEAILDNLPNLEILSDKKTDRAEGKKLVANLLFFVRTWDEEFIDNLQKAIGNRYFGILTDHVRDIVECKLNDC